jgi:hypothetical protein
MKSPLRNLTQFTFILLLAYVLVPQQALAQAADYSYTTNNDTITITAYNGSGGAVTIPDTINGLPVTSIGYEAFSSRYSVTSVTLPNSLLSIGQQCFFRCTNLTDVSIPNHVTFIGNIAFAHCLNLPSVIIPSSVTTMGINVFVQCPSLKAITVDPFNQFYSSVDGVLFDKSGTLLVEYPNGKAGSYTIPDGVTTIAGWAFQYSANMPSVTIPSSVTQIGLRAFELCSSLSTVFFEGNAPPSGIFGPTTPRPIVYYLPGTTGWLPMYDLCVTEPWFLPNPVILNIGSSYGIQTNTFGFTISWATNATFVVNASSSLANPNWFPVSTNTLIDGYSYFIDPQWMNYSNRFYQVRSQ